MDHDAAVVERQNSIGLVAMGGESSRQCMANHQSNYGVTRESRRAVSVCSCGSGKKDSGSLFAAAIGLALHIDDSDDGPLGRVLVVFDRVANACSEGKGLFQSDF